LSILEKREINQAYVEEDAATVRLVAWLTIGSLIFTGLTFLIAFAVVGNGNKLRDCIKTQPLAKVSGKIIRASGSHMLVVGMNEQLYRISLACAPKRFKVCNYDPPRKINLDNYLGRTIEAEACGRSIVFYDIDGIRYSSLTDRAAEM
jgi:hypothetical protein